MFTILAHNVNVEIQFFHMNIQWTDEWNRMKIDTIKTILYVQINFKISCSEFYNFVLNQNELLKLAKSIYKNLKILYHIILKLHNLYCKLNNQSKFYICFIQNTSFFFMKHILFVPVFLFNNLITLMKVNFESRLMVEFSDIDTNTKHYCITQY